MDDEPRCTLTAGSTCLCTGRAGCLAADEDGDDGFCNCEDYDCAGECCGVGNCSCTPTVTVQPSEAYL